MLMPALYVLGTPPEAARDTWERLAAALRGAIAA